MKVVVFATSGWLGSLLRRYARMTTLRATWLGVLKCIIASSCGGDEKDCRQPDWRAKEKRDKSPENS